MTQGATVCHHCWCNLKAKARQTYRRCLMYLIVIVTPNRLFPRLFCHNNKQAYLSLLVISNYHDVIEIQWTTWGLGKRDSQLLVTAVIITWCNFSKQCCKIPGKFQTYLKANKTEILKSRSWKDGLARKSTCCSCGGPEFSAQQHVGWLNYLWLWVQGNSTVADYRGYLHSCTYPNRDIHI